MLDANLRVTVLTTTPSGVACKATASVFGFNLEDQSHQVSLTAALKLEGSPSLQSAP